MSTPFIGIVENDNVSGHHGNSLNPGENGHRHGSEMDRHMVPLGYKLSLGIKDGARIVSSFLNIGGECGAPQSDSHFFCYRSVKGLKNLESDRIIRARAAQKTPPTVKG